eukprot:TRINITY_DN9736_c0_g1_i2.p1 TRINITY_DN9736_c0_g1~~TRINITY_DN9736_c0_g1_i2.p1  ORF type:complete len:254 (+),score=41.28 TRINITY_DN9736_c0_g1_i2:47-808(+)
MSLPDALFTQMPLLRGVMIASLHAAAAASAISSHLGTDGDDSCLLQQPHFGDPGEMVAEADDTSISLLQAHYHQLDSSSLATTAESWLYSHNSASGRPVALPDDNHSDADLQLLQTEECQDEDENCAAWSKLGECERNPTWMQPNCRRSCQKCVPQPPTTTSSEFIMGATAEAGRSRAFWHRLSSHLVNRRGLAVGQYKVKLNQVERCQQMCDDNRICKSFTACTRKDAIECYFKNRWLTGYEPRHHRFEAKS